MDNSSELMMKLFSRVKLESKTLYQTLKSTWDQPLNIRLSKGWAIEGLRLLGVNDNILLMECDTNESRFREGDLLVLHRSKPEDRKAIHVELTLDNETELEFQVIRGDIEQITSWPYNWIADADWFDVSQYYLKTLENIAGTARGRQLILPMLLGQLTPKMDLARYERSAENAALADLNDSQCEAIAQSYSTDLYHLVQGPPGTGKTIVLAHIAKQFVEDGKRVLITGLTHRAIGNALDKIYSVAPEIYTCKIGPERHAVDISVPNYEDFYHSGFDSLSGGYVIGATPFATQTKRLKNVDFDVVIFDEASQVTLPLAMMAMLKGERYIFVGDDQQLPPVTTLNTHSDLNDSIFTYLDKANNSTMLNTTYRMNKELTVWPSKSFYDGLLTSDQSAANRRLQLSEATSRWDFILDPTQPAVFVDIGHKNSTVRNRTEAELAVDLIIALLRHGISPHEIGVVVPYRAQSRFIRSLLRRASPDDRSWQIIAVDTVERMQGQEREVVILSLTTSNTSFLSQVSDFFFQGQRLNVAVTRPRTKLIILGSSHLLSTQHYCEDSTTDQTDLFKSLLDTCELITLPDGNIQKPYGAYSS